MKFIGITRGIVFASLLVTGSALADEDDLSIDDLPAVVRATVEREVGAGTIEDIEWESGPNGSHYEIEYVLGGQEWDLEVSDDGRVIEKKLD
jgi:hypothetical protein